MNSAVPHAERSWSVALLVFALVYVALYSGYMWLPDRLLVETIYYRGIVAPGAALIHLIAPADLVQGVDNRLVSGATVLEIVRGCDGAGVFFLLVAAIIAVRGTMGKIAWGVVGAIILVYLANQLRIVILYFVVRGHGDWFVPLHSYVFPTLFVLLGLAYFSFWVGMKDTGRDGLASAA